MKFKVDENMPADLAPHLREAGHDVADVVAEGLAGADDPPVLAAATAEGRILLTFDLDFADVRHYPPGTHAGIVSAKGFRLQPILPVVLYTGTQRWDNLGRLIDLVEMGELFDEVTPEHRPLFVSLPALPAAALESSGGHLGWVLELVQQRQARPEEFRDLLRRVVEHLETMPAAERLRWLELLSYLEAMVYHDRDQSEHEGLRDVILASVRTDEHRREVQAVVRSMADVDREKWGREGAVLALRKALLQVLRGRFRKVPKAVERTITATDDLARLESWMARFATATTLEEVGIESEG